MSYVKPRAFARIQRYLARMCCMYVRAFAVVFARERAFPSLATPTSLCLQLDAPVRKSSEEQRWKSIDRDSPVATNDFVARHRAARSLSKCVVDPTSIRGNRFDINYRLLPCTARCTGSDTEATWEDAPLCSRLAARLDTSITMQVYQRPVSMLARVSAVMYVNYRVDGFAARLS